MKNYRILWLLLLIVLLIVAALFLAKVSTRPITTTITTPALPVKPQMTEEEALSLATDVYIYGYPLVTMDLTREVMTNVTTPTATKAPMGQFANIREYPNATFRDVTAPNADTLYSVAWLDLSKEPYVLHVPDEKGRYYLMPMLTAWTEVFASPGTRTTGTGAHNFLIVGPNWKGRVPEELTKFKSSTNIVWILGRTYCHGSAEGYQLVHAIQDQYKLTPLSSYGKTYIPPGGVVALDVNMTKPVRNQVNALNADNYFKRLSLLMDRNPPLPQDAAMVAKMAKLGIIPGQEFDINKVDSIIARALRKSVRESLIKIKDHAQEAGVQINGWRYLTKSGNYGTDYLQRAFVAVFGLGANKPQDAVYPVASKDDTGLPLNGSNRYVIHFAKGQMPPVKAFWSLTMYNDQFFFVENPLNKYTVSFRDKLKKNQDGSIDIYIQHDSPGPDYEANWLPAPTDNFILMLRLYWPKEAVLKHSWQPPGVKKVQGISN